MNSRSKKFREEWAYYINPKKGKVQYNIKCKKCPWDCRQSYRAVIIKCPHDIKKTE